MVNIEAARRQALGAHFEAKPDDARRAADLVSGKLVLPPHAQWSLPSDPTWSEDPFSDNNWQFQFHMLRWLDPLRRVGQAGDAEAAELWAHYARSWVEANPPGAGQSRWAWIDMTDGIRALELSHGLCVVGEQDWLIRSLEQHRDWLADPAHIKAGNHGLHQTVGLFVVSAVLEDRAAMDTAVGWLSERLQQAWDEQGVNEEGSLAYHRMNYNWWQDTMTRLDLEGVPRPEGAERLELAPVEMAHATSPLGKLARIGDTNAASIADVDHPFAQYVTSNGAEGTHPEETTAVYERGYAYVRSGWGEDRPFNEETYLTAVFGPQNKVHGHRDGGSITYCSQGTQWLHDQGRFYYGKDPMQRYVVSRGAHSLIVLPGRTPRASAVVELVHQEETDAYVDLLFSDPSYDDVQISRRVIYLKHWDLTVVLDRVSAQEELTAEQRWHCGRGVEATSLSIGFALKHEGSSFHIAGLRDGQQRDVTAGQKDPLLGWTATGWRRSKPVNVASFRDQGAELRFDALLGAWTPAAADLLRARLRDETAVDTDLRDLIPAALLREPWPSASSPLSGRPSAGLRAQALVMGPETLRIVAEGPGRYFAFDLYDGRDLVRAGAWIMRKEHAFEITGVRRARIRVRNRSTPEDVQSTVIGPEEWALPLPGATPSPENNPVDDLRGSAGRSIGPEIRQVRRRDRGPLRGEHMMEVVAASHEPGEGQQLWRQESSFGTDPVSRWTDIADFHSAGHRPDGMHVIDSAHGGPYELFTRDEPFDQSGSPVLVIFSGAVTNRENRNPPFVSGRSLAPNLGLPLIALSDPSLSLAPDLSIAWYAGSQAQQVQAATEELLRPLAELLDGDLWLVGGSAGGFAALETGHRLGRRSSVFVWNPQTNIMDYFPRFVRSYSEAAFPSTATDLGGSQWKNLFAESMSGLGCRSDLIEGRNEDEAPRRLVCLQSADDWHVRSHAFPYLSARGYERLEPGVWTQGSHRVHWFAETGVGHAPPSSQNIHTILERLTGPGAQSMLERVLELDRAELFDRSRPWTRPEDLRSAQAQVASLVSWRVQGRRVAGSMRMLPADYGRLSWEVEVLDAQGRVLVSEKELPMPGSWEVLPGPEAHRVRVKLTDGMGHLLVRRHLLLGSAKDSR